MMGQQFVTFALDRLACALRLPAVERVVRMVAVTPLPRAPAVVLGVVDVGGELVPVIDLRRRFGLPHRGCSADDQIILARSARRRLALVVDAVTEVLDCPAERLVDARRIMPGVDYLEGVLQAEQGLTLVQDLDAFLSLDEERALDAALAESEPVP